MVATQFFGKRYINRVFEDFEKTSPIFLKKMVELLPARFQGPPKMGVTFFCPFLFLLFSVSSGSSERVLKKNYFYRVFLHTLLKHLVTSCNNKEVKPKLPKKKVHNFFFGNLFFDQKQLSKTLILHHPLKTNCAPKNLPKPLFL